jgi:hypothetical protein
MNLEKLDLEKYEQLELERSNTIADKEFQNWMSELNVSQSYEDRSGIIRANEINNQYNYSSLDGKGNIVYNILSLFK